MLNPECIFCKIIKGEIPSSKIYEDEAVLAFNDLTPVSPKHILLIPKIHKDSLNDFNDDEALLLGKLFIAARKIAEQEGFVQDGYRIVNNVGVNGGQTVSHLHLHILAGRKHHWPPG